MRARVAGALLFTLAICGLHFTAMAAVRLEFDPVLLVTDQISAPAWLAVAVAAVTVMIVALGFGSSVVDQHLADCAAQEAARLRAHVAELEVTKRQLEATTRDLETALAAAAAGSQAKSQFLAAMSHELRTPLNAVIGFSDLLSQEPFGALGDPRYHDYVRSIHASGAHLLALINDILDFSKLDAGRLELQEETVDAGAALREALRMTRLQAAGAGLTVDEAVESGLPLLLRADPRRLTQVLLNLLSNAIKFTPAGGTVRASAFRRGAGGVAFAIADSGIGIAAADIPKALERFGQVDNLTVS
jgi:signal transduction histidine kinase